MTEVSKIRNVTSRVLCAQTYNLIPAVCALFFSPSHAPLSPA